MRYFFSCLTDRPGWQHVSRLTPRQKTYGSAGELFWCELYPYFTTTLVGLIAKRLSTIINMVKATRVERGHLHSRILAWFFKCGKTFMLPVNSKCRQRNSKLQLSCHDMFIAVISKIIGMKCTVLNRCNLCKPLSLFQGAFIKCRSKLISTKRSKIIFFPTDHTKVKARKSLQWLKIYMRLITAEHKCS